jgi:hypothetical protein
MEPKPNTCRVEQTTPQMPTQKQNDQRQGRQHGLGQEYGSHWLEKGRDTKGKPPKNYAKHENEQGKKKALKKNRLIECP